MKGIKSALTRVINIFERFKEDDYGVSYESILHAMEQARSLLDAMGDKTATFEVQYMELKLRPVIQKINKEISEDEDVSEEGFRSLIECVHTIVCLVRTTYNMVVTGYMRSEQELQCLKEDLNFYRNKKAELEDYSDDCEEKWSNTEKNINQINEFSSKMENTLYPESKKSHEYLVERKEEAEELLAETKESCACIDEQLETINDLSEKSREINAQSDRNQKSTDDILRSSQEIKEKCITQQRTVDDILGDANRAGMAGAFKQKADDMAHRGNKAKCTFYGFAMATSALGIGLFYHELLFGTFINYYLLPFKIFVLFPFVWIAWSQYKASSEYFDLEKGYSHKATTAQAYEGFNRRMNEGDEDMRRELLGLSIRIFGQSPDEFLDKGRPSSPISEIVDKGAGIVKSSIPLSPGKKEPRITEKQEN